MTGRGSASRFANDVVVVGGCGHAGLPLAIALADRGKRVAIYDISVTAVAAVNAARLPFSEPGAAPLLLRAIESGLLAASADPAIIGTAEHVIVVITGPAGEAQAESEPDLGPDAMAAALAGCSGQFRDGQIMILRSTVSPGTTASVEKLVASLGIDMDVAFCPERIAEGQAMTELYDLPQIIASRTARGLHRCAALFGVLTPVLVPLTPEEAELAKLFTNAWRYIRFAAANQFYMIASDFGLDYERIRSGLVRDYPRAAGLAPAGFTAGPCLLKDTAGLARASAGCTLGRAAIAVNEGLPGYLVSRLELRFELASMTVGILGMAFKGGSDDTRASLSYRLAGLLAGRARAVLCTDPLVTSDPGLLPLETVLDRADLLVIAAPHPHYRGLRTDKPVADIWDVLGRGVLA
ncbi:MAG TPA: nucleotide sugar dehydrogenase [Streptosporangiaceae bacterium]|nr:nucleotide sugar dehydrogenase [Streptosporangiaceae bacterium]